MPSLTNGTGAVSHTPKMRYAELPDLFEDAQQVGSDWYTLSVFPGSTMSFAEATPLGCHLVGV